MTSWREIWKKCFTHEECQRIIDFGLSIPAVDGGVGHGGKFTINKDMRSSTIRWLPRWDKELLWLYDRISARAEWSNNKSFGFDLRVFTEVQFTEYEADSNGHYSWHEDNTWVTDKPMQDERKMSMVIQLSDPATYEGGKLELHNAPLKDGEFGGQGDMIFFPSFNRHQVTPVTSGKRYSLVTWFKGPPFR